MFDIVNEMNVELNLRYLPISAIDTAEKCYDIYYGGMHRIQISRGSVTIGGQFFHLEKGEDYSKYVEMVHDVLSKDVSKHIFDAMDNLGMEAEELKYFDRDLSEYDKFMKEVSRLMLPENRDEVLEKLV